MKPDGKGGGGSIPALLAGAGRQPFRVWGCFEFDVLFSCSDMYIHAGPAFSFLRRLLPYTHAGRTFLPQREARHKYFFFRFWTNCRPAVGGVCPKVYVCLSSTSIVRCSLSVSLANIYVDIQRQKDTRQIGVMWFLLVRVVPVS